MKLRQILGIALLALGGWLAYGALDAILHFMGLGGGLASALFEPPTGFIRLLAAGVLIVGGIMVCNKVKGGGFTGVGGSILFIALGGLMASAGASQELWLDELIYGLAALALSGLILTFRRI